MGLNLGVPLAGDSMEVAAQDSRRPPETGKYAESKRSLLESAMMLIFTIKTRGILLIAALGIALCFTSPAHALQAWYIVDLESKEVTQLGSGSGYNNINAIAINDAGQVVGTFKTTTGATRSFITGPDGIGMTDVGTLGGSNSVATAINDAGQVVGTFKTATGVTHSFITGPNGVGMTDLGSLSYPGAINNAGQVAMQVQGHTFITGPNGVGMTDLGTLGGESSRPNAINDAGQVAGSSEFEPRIPAPHAFFSNGAGMTDLGTLPGGPQSEATAINNAGQVVGYSYTTDLSVHAFITGPNGTGMTDLGTLGGPYSIAQAINDVGQVVGFSYTTPTATDEGRAFITGPNGMGMIDLNSLVSLSNGVVLNEAVGINDHGQVLVLAIPEPASYAMLLAGLTLLGIMALHRRANMR